MSRVEYILVIFKRQWYKYLFRPTKNNNNNINQHTKSATDNKKRPTSIFRNIYFVIYINIYLANETNLTLEPSMSVIVCALCTYTFGWAKQIAWNKKKRKKSHKNEDKRYQIEQTKTPIIQIRAKIVKHTWWPRHQLRLWRLQPKLSSANIQKKKCAQLECRMRSTIYQLRF